MYTYSFINRQRNRTLQTIPQGNISPVITEYLLEVQPGLTGRGITCYALAADDGTNTEHYIHGPRGIHAMAGSSGNWLHPAQDWLSH